LSILSRLLSLILNGIGNIRKGLYDPPENTQGLTELLPPEPDSGSAPHLVSNIDLLTIVIVS